MIFFLAPTYLTACYVWWSIKVGGENADIASATETSSTAEKTEVNSLHFRKRLLSYYLATNHTMMSLSCACVERRIVSVLNGYIDHYKQLADEGVEGSIELELGKARSTAQKKKETGGKNKGKKNRGTNKKSQSVSTSATASPIIPRRVNSLQALGDILRPKGADYSKEEALLSEYDRKTGVRAVEATAETAQRGSSSTPCDEFLQKAMRDVVVEEMGIIGKINNSQDLVEKRSKKFDIEAAVKVVFDENFSGISNFENFTAKFINQQLSSELIYKYAVEENFIPGSRPGDKPLVELYNAAKIDTQKLQSPVRKFKDSLYLRSAISVDVALAGGAYLDTLQTEIGEQGMRGTDRASFKSREILARYLRWATACKEKREADIAKTCRNVRTHAEEAKIKEDTSEIYAAVEREHAESYYMRMKDELDRGMQGYERYLNQVQRKACEKFLEKKDKFSKGTISADQARNPIKIAIKPFLCPMTNSGATAFCHSVNRVRARLRDKFAPKFINGIVATIPEPMNTFEIHAPMRKMIVEENFETREGGDKSALVTRKRMRDVKTNLPRVDTQYSTSQKMMFGVLTMDEIRNEFISSMIDVMLGAIDQEILEPIREHMLKNLYENSDGGWGGGVWMQIEKAEKNTVKSVAEKAEESAGEIAASSGAASEDCGYDAADEEE